MSREPLKGDIEVMNKSDQVQNEIDSVTEKMKTNIQSALDRGDKIDELDEKSQNVMAQADAFNKKSKEVRCAMYKKWLMSILAMVLVAVVLGVIIYFATKD